MRAIVTAAILGALILPAQRPLSRAQTAQTTPAPVTVRGRVVADDTGDPVRNARVTVTGAMPDELGNPVVLTDGDGRFSTQAIKPSRAIASKPGYGRAEIPVAGAADPLEIRLARGAAISGRVVDELGEPVLSAVVEAEVPGPSARRPTVAARTSTDDRGEYHLGSLAAGTFTVAAFTIGAPAAIPLRGGNMVAFSPRRTKTYYPGTTEPGEAEALSLAAGDEQTDIDFTVPAAESGSQPFSAMRQAPFGFARPSAPGSKPPTGIIRGGVRSTDGGSLASAQVVLVSTNNALAPRMTRSDADGRYEFADLPAGTFRVVASKAGYFPVSPRRASPYDTGVASSAPSVNLADGESRQHVDVALARWSTLSGHVVDEYGDPIQGASVQLMQVRYEDGRRRLVGDDVTTRLTDDRGAYRLYGLSPGQYIVSAAVGGVDGADVPGYARAYYPGVTNPAQAQFVAVGAADDLAGIDLPLSRIRTFLIAGRIVDAAGQPSTGGSLRLTSSQSSSSVTSASMGARIRDDGRFEFPNVAPGQYVIQVDRGRSLPWKEGEFCALPVAVTDGDVTGLLLQTTTGSSVTGRITFDASDPSKRPSPGDVELTPTQADLDRTPQGAAEAEIDPDWTFRMAGLHGERRLQIRRAPAGWALGRVLVNGIDVTDRPLHFGEVSQSLTDVEVVLTDRVSELHGTVVDDDARGVPAATTIVFSVDRDRWYPTSRFLRKAVANADGAFTIEGLPFGSYYVAAVAQPPNDGDDAWQDPAFLDSLIAHALEVTMRDGQTQSIELKLARPPR